MNETELISFHTDLLQEVRTSQYFEEEGAIQEQCFTKKVLDLLAEAGETENVRIAYDEKRIKVGTQTGIQHKINGYAIYSNYETVDLFITFYNGKDEIIKVSKIEIDKDFKRIISFFQNAVEKKWVEHIEESSEIFEFAHTLDASHELRNSLVRVNLFILTDGFYSGEVPKTCTISGYQIYYRVIDLNYLFNITKQSHVPIEINFKDDGFKVPCIACDIYNEEYESYLAIIPGSALANIYERFGQRLLEQNVRTFLQFSGKVNKGIRSTIIDESHMFFAYNNGIAVTAEEILIEKEESNTSLNIAWIKDFQIVNGGQTTASIYHTWKKYKADISKIFVPVKISIIKNKNKFSEVVGRISEYANTQNKVSVTDLSSNRPFHIDLEKISRIIWLPPKQGQSFQSRWFYERSRGQYKNEKNREGFTKARLAVFEMRNPKNQMFNKEDLAKYINSYQEVYQDKKLVIGPHYVIRGNQKNYVQFMNYNIPEKPDNVYFEDTVAKAIIFKTVEKLYGIKPNSIGDLRYITVPYSIAYLGNIINYDLNLLKIWKYQVLSENFRNQIYVLMVKVEAFIKQNAPGALYSEWAKKEECWNMVKAQNFGVQTQLLTDDLGQCTRTRLSETQIKKQYTELTKEHIKSIPPEIWLKIEQWGCLSNQLSDEMQNIAHSISNKIIKNEDFDHNEMFFGIDIINKVSKNVPEILSKIDKVSMSPYS